MTQELQIMRDLEVSLTARSSAERLQMLHSVTDLFLNNASQHSDAQIELFDDVFCRLVQHVETRALAELSLELAPVDTAPRRIIGRLARHDEIVVSGPVLTQSNRLQTDDLIEIASTKSQAHLAAIGSRSLIEEAVTDVLVEKGNTDVARVIARNSGARFSTSGFSVLVNRAHREEGLTELVALRGEVSPDQLRQLVLRATATVRRRLIAAARPELRGRIDAVLDRIAADINRAETKPSRDYAAAQQLAERMRHDPALMRARLKEAAEDDEFELSVAVLAALGRISVSAVERVMVGSDPGGLLLLCKALDLEWPVVRPILLLHPAGKRATPMQLDRWCEQLARINASTAARVVRFWQVRAVVVPGLATSRQKSDEASPASGHLNDWSSWTLQ